MYVAMFYCTVTFAQYDNTGQLHEFCIGKVHVKAITKPTKEEINDYNWKIPTFLKDRVSVWLGEILFYTI